MPARQPDHRERDDSITIDMIDIVDVIDIIEHRHLERTHIVDIPISEHRP